MKASEIREGEYYAPFTYAQFSSYKQVGCGQVVKITDHIITLQGKNGTVKHPVELVVRVNHINWTTRYNYSGRMIDERTQLSENRSE